MQKSPYHELYSSKIYDVFFPNNNIKFVDVTLVFSQYKTSPNSEPCLQLYLLLGRYSEEKTRRRNASIRQELLNSIYEIIRKKSFLLELENNELLLFGFFVDIKNMCSQIMGK